MLPHLSLIVEILIGLDIVVYSAIVFFYVPEFLCSQPVNGEPISWSRGECYAFLLPVHLDVRVDQTINGTLLPFLM